MIEEMGSLREAMNIMEAIRPDIEIVSNALTYVFVKKDKNGTPELSDFVKDSVILDKMTVVESDRLLRRFVNKCERVGQKKRPEDVEEGFMNIVGELTLITMGIIRQEMFTLGKSDIDPEVYKDVRESFKRIGLDADKVFKSYNLRTEGTFFWNRWSTVDQKPSRVTDEKIREFLTQTVRADREAVFDAIGFGEMVNKIREINKTSEEDDARDQFGELFTETFSSEKFSDALMKLLKDKWYKKLEVFYG